MSGFSAIVRASLMDGAKTVDQLTALLAYKVIPPERALRELRRRSGEKRLRGGGSINYSEDMEGVYKGTRYLLYGTLAQMRRYGFCEQDDKAWVLTEKGIKRHELDVVE